MSATARALGRLADLGHDPHAGRPEVGAELPVAADGRRQRIGPELVAGPEHHELEGAIDGQRVGQPSRAQAAAPATRTAGATCRTRPAIPRSPHPSTRSIPCIAGPWNRTGPIDLVARQEGRGSGGSFNRRVPAAWRAASTTSARAWMTSRPLASVPRSSTGTRNSSPSRTALPAATSSERRLAVVQRSGP